MRQILGPLCVTLITRLTSGLWRFSYAVTVVATALFLVILVGAMGLRLLNHPLKASEELSSLCFVWACFGGAAMAYRRGSHIRLLFLIERLGKSPRRLVEDASRLLTIFFLAVVCHQGVLVILQLKNAHMAISGLPQWVAYLPAPLFCGIMIVFGIEALLGARPNEEARE